MIWRRPIVMNVADLWPDSAEQLGLLDEGVVLRALRAFERWSYRRARFVCAVTDGVRRVLLDDKGVPPEKVVDLPNGVDTSLFAPRPGDRSVLREWGLEDRRVILYAGTVGYAHGVETAVEAIRLGAYDYIEKPLSTAKLLVTVERALQADQLRKENLNLRRHLEPASELIGNSEVLRNLREQIQRIAASDSWVLITGEPGSGKGVAARYLHNQSARAAGRFVDVSLAAIPPQSIAVQLFGSEEGTMVNPGRFEQASGGSLFLDEVADMDLDTQAKLLSALEEQRFVRVGGSRYVDVDVRIIAATNQDLEVAISEGRFREDLYYRLNVVPLSVPSLRAHREDIPELVEFYLDWMVDKEGLPYRSFPHGALNVLRNHDWPGNVRELRSEEHTSELQSH